MSASVILRHRCGARGYPLCVPQRTYHAEAGDFRLVPQADVVPSENLSNSRTLLSRQCPFPRWPNAESPHAQVGLSIESCAQVVAGASSGGSPSVTFEHLNSENLSWSGSGACSVKNVAANIVLGRLWGSPWSDPKQDLPGI